MTHKPPVPPGNQSPYPIEEPRHPHLPHPPIATAEPDEEKRDHGPPAGLIVGVVAAVVAVGVGLAATLLRREKPKHEPRRTRKRKS